MTLEAVACEKDGKGVRRVEGGQGEQEKMVRGTTR